jgi:hypothetical protein
LLVSAAACGGGKATGGSGGSSGTTPGIGSTNGMGSDGGTSSSLWPVMSATEVSVQGGTALAASGQGQNGGVVHLVAQGDTSFDPTQAPAKMKIPTAPSGATPIAASALGADVSIAGDAVVSADVTSSGSDAVRKISASGDLYVTANLQAGDLGGGRQGLDLEAGGTIYVSGAVDASGASGSGQAGGALRLAGKQVIVTGTLSSAGGDGTQSGGAAGALTVQTSGNVLLAGTVLFRGGAATGSGSGGAQGGAAAALTIDANGSVAIGGTVDGRGGVASASASGGTIAGGAAGAIHIGEMAPPTTITIFAPVVVSGGAGGASAGTGGTITPEPDTGNVNVAGAMELDLRGGNSMTAPGAGGLLNGGPRKDPGSGGVHISGEIVASGGSIMKGGSGNGADGGRIDMELAPTDGAVTIDQAAKITVEGGDAGGSGTAGGGGHVWFWTKDGDEMIAGHVSVRGGNAPDAGGIGGGGGMIYFFSDNNHNGVQVCKGNLDLLPTGVLDASGGDGSTGGSARNNGKPGVAAFPEMQETFAVFLNCDGAHGNTCNWMKNEGQIIARGGVHNGNGGDVTYHGIPPGVLGTGGPGSGDYPVPSGMVDNAADGTGVKGDFDGE